MAKTNNTSAKAAEQIRAQDTKNQLQLQSKRKEMQGMLEHYKDDFARILPSQYPAERLIGAAMSCMTRNPDLLECTPSSIISALLTCGSLGLLPDGVLGECYLEAERGPSSGIMYCSFMIGYKGLIALGNRSGQVQTIQAKAVYAANEEGGDLLEYEHGLTDIFRHKASGTYDTPDRVTHFWVKVVLMNGGILWDVWTRRQVEAVRDDSKQYKAAAKKEDTYWHKYFISMGCKTLLKNILKTVTLSPDLGRAIALDDMANAGVKQNTEFDYVDSLQSKEFQDAVYQDVTLHEVAIKEEAREQQRIKATGKGAQAVTATQDLINTKAKKSNAKK